MQNLPSFPTFDIDDDMLPTVEKLLPAMRQAQIIDRTMRARDIRSRQIMEYAEKVGVSIMNTDDKNNVVLSPPREFLDRLKKFTNVATIFSRRMSFLDQSQASATYNSSSINTQLFKQITGKKGGAISSDAVIYMSRKPYDVPHEEPEDDQEDTAGTTPGSKLNTQRGMSRSRMKSNTGTGGAGGWGGTALLPGQGGALLDMESIQNQENSLVAQRKVAKALQQMTANETMLFHFVTKGGIEAINRLVHDASDHEVYFNCAKTILRASKQSHYCPIMIAKDIIPTMQHLVDGGDEDIWLCCAQILQHLSYHSDSQEADTLIILNGVFPVIQAILQHAKRQDTLCYMILVMNNLAPVFDGDMASFIIRAVIGMSGRLEVLSNLSNAIFFTDMLRSISRLPRYMNGLCEESVLPVLLNTMNEFFHPQIINNMAEGFVNLSMSKKNRREISGCGVSQYLDRIFVMGSPEAKAHVLRMIGNLLSSNLFHDRIAREDTLTSMLNNLLDPTEPAQFSGVSFCLSQLAAVATSVSALVQVDVVRIILGHLRSIPTDALGYIFTLLVTVASKPEFSEKLILEQHLLIPFLYVQAVSSGDDGHELGPLQDFIGTGGTLWTQNGQKETLASLASNLCLLTDFTASIANVPKLSLLLVNMLKHYVKEDASVLGRVRVLALNALVNLTLHNPATRAVLMGGEGVKYKGSGNHNNTISNNNNSNNNNSSSSNRNAGTPSSAGTAFATGLEDDQDHEATTGGGKEWEGGVSNRRESFSSIGKPGAPMQLNETPRGVTMVKGLSTKNIDNSTTMSSKNKSKKSENNSNINNNSPEKQPAKTVTNKPGVGVGGGAGGGKQGGSIAQGSGGSGSATSEDLIEIVKSIGYDDADLNLRFIALINILSNEENLCTRLLDRGTHFVLVAILSSLTGPTDIGLPSQGLSGSHKKSAKGHGLSSPSGLLPAVVVSSPSPAHSPVNKSSRRMGTEKGGGHGAGGKEEDSLIALVETVNRRIIEQEREELLGETTRGRDGNRGRGRRTGQPLVGSSDEGKDLIKEMAAATIHNISLKRAVLGPGILTCLLSLTKGCKTIRVLHCVRAMANVSQNMKAKMMLAKETRLIPVLVDAMRSGCDEAERVQHYGAQVICNVLAGNLDKSVLEDLIKNKVVTDIVVVALLRVQGLSVKESLAKALFNLLSHDRHRAEMIDLQVLSAVMELAKIESQEILELATRCVYNITCQTALLSDRIRTNGVPNYLLSRATGFKAHDFDKARSPSKAAEAKVHEGEEAAGEQGKSIVDFGSQAKQDQLAELGLISSTTVKLLCGMGLANVSFDKSIATSLCCDMGTDAILSVFKLNTDQAAYCAAAVIYNTSKLTESMVFITDLQYLPTVMQALERGPVVCSQLVAAALVNYSQRPPFFEQLGSVAVGAALRFMDSPSVDESIKTDILKMIYNLVCRSDTSRFRVVEADGMAVLWRYAKNQEDEAMLCIVGRIVRECCTCAGDLAIHKKLMRDGVMRILLKLAKVENPPLKTDISYAIFDMTVGPSCMAVLKWDGVDVLYWLTMHDCMNLFDTVRLNVAMAIRNFSANSVEDCKYLAEDERCILIIRALTKSMKEEVLQHAIGTIYNLMTIETCKQLAVKYGVIKTIFELASAGFMSVRHVCSSCLHMAPEAIPDMSDPAVLELVLCLLDIDPEMVANAEKGSMDALKQGYVGVKSKEPLPYVLPTKQHATFFVSQGTDFQQTWLTLTSDIDTTYTPALIPLPAERPMSDLDLRSFLTMANLATASGGDAGLPPVPALTSLLASRENNNETLTAATMAAFGERMIKHEKYDSEAYDDFRELTQAVEARGYSGGSTTTSAKVIGALESQSSVSMLSQRNNKAGEGVDETGEGEDSPSHAGHSLTTSGRMKKHDAAHRHHAQHLEAEHLHAKNFKHRKGPMLGAPNPDAYEHSAGIAMKRHTRSAEKALRSKTHLTVAVNNNNKSLQNTPPAGGSPVESPSVPSSPDRLSLVGAHASNWGFAEPSSSSSSVKAHGGRGSLGSSVGGSRSSSPLPRGMGDMMDVTAPVPSSPQPPVSRLSTSHSNRAGTSQGSRGILRSGGSANTAFNQRGYSPQGYSKDRDSYPDTPVSMADRGDGDADAFQMMAVSNSMSPVHQGSFVGMGSPIPTMSRILSTRVSFTINENNQREREGVLEDYVASPSLYQSPKQQNHTQTTPTSSNRTTSLTVTPSQVHFPRLSTNTKIPHNTLGLIKTQSFRGQTSPAMSPANSHKNPSTRPLADFGEHSSLNPPINKIVSPLAGGGGGGFNAKGKSKK